MKEKEGLLVLGQDCLAPVLPDVSGAIDVNALSLVTGTGTGLGLSVVGLDHALGLENIGGTDEDRGRTRNLLDVTIDH